MIKVLFVCLGNICRSPLAEGIFKQHVKEAGLQDRFHIESAGTSGWHIGQAPDPRSIEVAKANGVPLDSLGRKAVNVDFEMFDYIIAMDSYNLSDLKNMPSSSEQGAAKLYLMRDFDDLAKGEDVPDPYYGSEGDFISVYEILDRSCLNLLNEIKKTHSIK